MQITREIASSRTGGTRNDEIDSYSRGKSLKTIALVIIFLTLAILKLTPVTYVLADSFSLAVSPPIIKIMIKPGKTISKSIIVSNQADPTVAKVLITPFTPVDSTGTIILVDCNKTKVSSCQAIPWFDLASTTFFLKAREEKPVNFKIHVPENAPTGDYYLVLLVAGDEPAQTNATGVSLTGRIGANLLLTVSPNGKTEKNGRIASLKSLNGVSLPIGQNQLTLIDSFDEIGVELTVENMGRTFFTTSGTLALASPFLPEIHFPLNRQVVLSGSTRLLQVQSEKSDWEGGNGKNATSYLATHTFPSSFYIGMTDITAKVILEDLALALSSEGKEGKQPELAGKVRVLALPFKLSVTVIIAVLLFLWVSKRRKI